MKTFLAKKETVEPKWFVVDASGQVLGRLSVKIANILRGRNKPTYTPHVDTGDFVVVINADKVVLTGKKEEQKSYMFYSGYVGGESYRAVADVRVKKPAFIIEHAVKGMLPKNRLARHMLKKMKVYGGTEHPHEAQNPTPISL
jgi:large subunit ribosomal protein L13